METWSDDRIKSNEFEMMTIRRTNPPKGMGPKRRPLIGAGNSVNNQVASLQTKQNAVEQSRSAGTAANDPQPPPLHSSPFFLKNGDRFGAIFSLSACPHHRHTVFKREKPGTTTRYKSRQGAGPTSASPHAHWLIRNNDVISNESPAATVLPRRRKRSKLDNDGQKRKRRFGFAGAGKPKPIWETKV